MRPSILRPCVFSSGMEPDANLAVQALFLLLLLTGLHSGQGQKAPREDVLKSLVYHHNKEDNNIPYEACTLPGDSDRFEYFHANSEVGKGLGYQYLHLYGLFKGHGGMAAAHTAATAFMKLLTDELIYIKNVQKEIWDWSDNQEVIRQRNQHLWGIKHTEPEPFPFMNMPMHIKDDYSIDYKAFLLHNLTKADDCISVVSPRQDRIQGCNSGTIFTIVVLDGNNDTDDVFVINVGDSHAIVKDAKGVTQLTSKEPIDSTKGKGTIGDFEQGSKQEVTGHFNSYSSQNKEIQFLLLASKGLWDNFTNEEAAAYMSNCQQTHSCTAKNFAIESYDKYKDKQSENITIIFVDLRSF